MATPRGINVSREQLHQWYYEESRTTAEIAEIVDLLGIAQSKEAQPTN
jgi:hypothetical protein